MSLSWYVVQVATNMEDRVQQSIIDAINQRINSYTQQGDHKRLQEIKQAFNIATNCTDEYEIAEFLQEHTILVPKEKVEEVKNGKKKENERKIFPGYILVYMDYNDDFGLLIRKTPRVSGFVGVAKDSRPVPISQKEVDGILQQVKQSKEQAKHKIEFDVGERVHVVDGPFTDFSATIQEVVYAKSKLKVNVQIFGRDTMVELDFGQVEKVF